MPRRVASKDENVKTTQFIDLAFTELKNFLLDIKIKRDLFEQSVKTSFSSGELVSERFYGELQQLVGVLTDGGQCGMAGDDQTVACSLRSGVLGGVDGNEIVVLSEAETKRIEKVYLMECLPSGDQISKLNGKFWVGLAEGYFNDDIHTQVRLGGGGQLTSSAILS